MSNFNILFSNPWLLLLLIPALLFTVLPYFRIQKRYRCTRNRVCSMVLHGIIMVCAVMLLAGLTFTYTVPNTENALIVLVDVSYSNENAQEREDEYIQSIVNACGDDCQLGIVKFAYDQVYAGELSLDTQSVYTQYLNSDDPDTSATDLASALKYAASLFDSPETSKIVIVSDGIETDGDAANAIKTVAAQGIKIDTAYFGNAEENEVEITGVTLPDYNLTVDVAETLSVTVQGNINYDGDIKVFLTDTTDTDEVRTEVYSGALAAGVQTIQFEYAFTSPGIHTLCFEITHDKDTLLQNNSYFSYINLEVFDKVLVLESNVGESDTVVAMLEENDYDITVLNTGTSASEIPSDLLTLSEYDQVILVNIAYSDLPTGFEELLYEYVYDLGGGLFTVGGENEYNSTGDLVSHAYNQKDLLESTYLRKMLPVDVVDGYTPPVSFMLVVDCSGSMGKTKLQQAIDGALSCLDKLSSRDYVGIIEFGATAHVTLSMTSCADTETIKTAMLGIGSDTSIGSSTSFTQALYLAGVELSRTTTAFKHIILITDGQPNDSTSYQKYITSNYENYGITMSVIGIALNSSAYALMLSDVALCNCEGQAYNISDTANVAEVIYSVFEENVLDVINADVEPFQPEITDVSSSLAAGIKQADMPTLTGYYGTVLRSGATAYLTGPYDVPIYAQWTYGAGTVGSFLCSLSTEAEWSSEFAISSTGRRFVYNAVASLMPTESIEQNEITANFVEKNYTNRLNVYTDIEEGGWIDVTVTAVSADAAFYYNASNPIEVTMAANYTRFTFSIVCSGMYKIVIDRKDSTGAITESLTIYKTFSYSEEYNEFPETDGEAFMVSLAESGNGMVVTDAQSIFDSFDKYLNKVFDPRIVLLIIIIVLLLLDVAVRKFKFKWPHELVRQHKEKKLLEKQKAEAI